MRAALFLVAGMLALASTGLNVFGPAYYAPEGVFDYLAVVLFTTTLLATGIALIELFRNPLATWRPWPLLFPGGGAIAAGSGNLLEDVFNVEWAEWAFLFGGVAMVFGLVIAGLVILVVNSRRRWTGSPLIAGGVCFGLGDVGVPLMGLTWLAFGTVLFLLDRNTVTTKVPEPLPVTDEA